MAEATRRWTLHEPHAGAAALAADLRVSPLLAQLLLNRGLTDADAGRQFLRPTLKLLHDPATIPNLTRAAQRIAAAIAAGDKIVIYGDYDVDGITATSILWHAIRTLGGVVDYYIPHRVDEGYGLHGEAIEQICGGQTGEGKTGDGGAKLIVTVDCGVTAVEAAAVAARCGVDLIITDHHEFHSDHLPDCFTVVHPRLPESSYENPHLCGAGVAFKLAWAIGTAVSGAVRVSEPFRAFLLEATALAALGTIADVVPLIGENRVLAHFGLGGLKASKLTGIQALIEAAGLTGQTLDSYHVGFLLGPRMNAAGRMGHARLAVEMLTTATPERAREIADYLETQNRDRQAIERQILAAAIEQVDAFQREHSDARAIVVGDVGWHPGVIGIVASRLVDRYHKPAIVISLGGSTGRSEGESPVQSGGEPMAEAVGQGSGRSIAGFHLAQALDACDEWLIGHGGHEMAAGLKIEPANFPAFRDAFLRYAADAVAPEMLVRQLHLDVAAELSQLTEAVVNDLKRLGPFGMGNHRPMLCVPTVELAAPPRRVGKTGDHLQMYVRQGQTSMKCIAFGAGNRCDELKPGMALRLAAEPQLNEFNGRTSVELAVKDMAIEHG